MVRNGDLDKIVTVEDMIGAFDEILTVDGHLDRDVLDDLLVDAEDTAGGKKGSAAHRTRLLEALGESLGGLISRQITELVNYASDPRAAP